METRRQLTRVKAIVEEVAAALLLVLVLGLLVPNEEEVVEVVPRGRVPSAADSSPPIARTTARH